MMKFITMLICAVLSIGTAAAQSTKTYTGYVVDKYGNPVIGAEIMSPGGGASAITDSDGSFTIEVPFMLKKLTASYTGMWDKTLKLGKSSNLVFKMKSLKKRTGFISFFGGGGYAQVRNVGIISSNGSFGYGIMGGQIGQLGKWGWYIKGCVCGFQHEYYEYWNGHYYDDHWTSTFGSLTAGAIRKLGSKAHLYFGAGLNSGEWNSWGFSVDLGTLFSVGKHFNIIAGINYLNSYSNDFYFYDDGYVTTWNMINLNIGVGYTF